MEINVKKIVMFEGGVETLAYFSKQMAEQFVKMGYAVFFYNLKDVELQIITLRHIRRICPENRMIRRLRTEFHLTQPFMCRLCSFLHRLCQQFLCHKMGTGTGCQVSTVFYQL